MSSLRDDARRALRDLSASLRTVQRLVDYIERNPDALLSGKREPNK